MYVCLLVSGMYILWHAFMYVCLLDDAIENYGMYVCMYVCMCVRM